MSPRRDYQIVERIEPTGRAVPAVFDSPHSGRNYPRDFDFSLPMVDMRYAEDAFVDELFGSAPTHGAVLVRALFPRSYIDPNRPPDDIDDTMLEAPWPDGANPGPKTELGIGLIPKHEPGGAVYDRKLSVAEVRRRLDAYYWHYHRTLASAIDEAHTRAGSVWHVNCHSMPSVSNAVSPEGPGAKRPEFCLGDRDGTTCSPDFTRLVADTLSDMGYEVAVNDPYKGVELVRRYSDPERGRHSLQIEVNRALYMDERTIEKHGGFARLRSNLTRLVATICNHAATVAGV